MAFLQFTPVTGLEIIWSSGDGRQKPGGYTAEDIDNEIFQNGSSSIMNTHLTLFNKWLVDCGIKTDAGEEAETADQQKFIKRTFLLLCYYAYAKQGLLLNLANVKCDCNCEIAERKFLKSFSEDVICKSIRNECLKQKYLNWLHDICDSKSIAFDFFGSDIITIDCERPYTIRHNSHHSGGCESCGS